MALNFLIFRFSQTRTRLFKNNSNVKGATKLQPWIIFVPATIIDGNPINILNCYFGK